MLARLSSTRSSRGWSHRRRVNAVARGASFARGRQTNHDRPTPNGPLGTALPAALAWCVGQERDAFVLPRHRRGMCVVLPPLTRACAPPPPQSPPATRCTRPRRWRPACSPPPSSCPSFTSVRRSYITARTVHSKLTHATRSGAATLPGADVARRRVVGAPRAVGVLLFPR